MAPRELKFSFENKKKNHTVKPIAKFICDAVAMVDVVHVHTLSSQSPNQVRRRQGESVGANPIELAATLLLSDMKKAFSASCGSSPALATQVVLL